MIGTKFSGSSHCTSLIPEQVPASRKMTIYLEYYPGQFQEKWSLTTDVLAGRGYLTI